MSNKLVKSVAFNIATEQELVEHISNVNFSRYVKDLIIADIRKRQEALKIIHKSQKGGIKIVVGK